LSQAGRWGRFGGAWSLTHEPSSHVVMLHCVNWRAQAQPFHLPPAINLCFDRATPHLLIDNERPRRRLPNKQVTLGPHPIGPDRPQPNLGHPARQVVDNLGYESVIGGPGPIFTLPFTQMLANRKSGISWRTCDEVWKLVVGTGKDALGSSLGCEGFFDGVNLSVGQV
jgi:hypothetical protein